MDEIKTTLTSDVLYAAIRAGLGSVPVLGAAATELFGLVVTPPLDKRRQKWMNDVAEKLKDLEEKNEISFSSLSKNEQFLDTIIQATGYALKTGEAEKIKAFKNAVINTAVDEAPEKTKGHLFLTYLDAFTVWHIKILHFLDNPKRWFTDSGQRPPNFLMSSISGTLQAAFPTLQGQDELVDVIWKDLGNAGFHRSGDLKTMMSGDGALADRTTGLGKEFIAFITEQ